MRGSITIFATMLLMLVSQFLFTVLEAGRNLTLTNIACMNSEAVAESVFAQYCRPLWDEYHLLAYDAGSDAMGNVDIENVKSYMKQLTTDNFKISDSGAFAGGTIVNGTSMLRLSMDELESMKYVLMTDDGGDVYTNAVVSYMKKNIGYETVKNLYSQYSSLNENKSAGEYDDRKIDSALKALKDNAAHEGGGKSIARSSPPRAYSAPSSVSKAKQTSESKAESTEGGNAIENPLVKVQKVKASGILSQVVDESTVSGNSIDTSARVSGRSLHKGTGGWSESSDDWYAKVLMQQYILKASYTLEAAVIFPLVAGFFVFILFFFRVVQVESQVKAALYYSSRMSALASSANDSSVVSVATAEVLFRSRISDSKHIDTYVSGGRYGVSLLGSKMDGDDVALKAKYKVKLPVSFFTVDGIWIEDYSNSRKWTGKNPGEKTDPYVFYTDYGSVYHLSEQCNYLDLSIKSIKWSQVGASRNKDGRKYHACYCAADKKTEGSTVFITDYGTNYHGKLGCSKLKRTVHKVHKSEVDGKNLCSKCKGEGT